MKEEKETELLIKSKTNVGQVIGITVAVLAVASLIVGVTFALIGGGKNPPAADSGGGGGCTTAPGPFTLTFPAAGAIDVNRNGGYNNNDTIVNLTLRWTPSSGTNGYRIYQAKYPNAPVFLTTVTTTSYTLRTPLDFSTKYNWQVQAYITGCGNIYNSGGQKQFTTLAAPPTAYNPVAYNVEKAIPTQASCGGNRVCVTESPNRDIVTCDEYNALWAACTGNTNRCPENLAEQCKEMTVCQCSTYDQGSKLGQMVSPGGDDCKLFNDVTFTGNADLSGPFKNPCAP